MEKRRFTSGNSYGGVWSIKDSQDDSVVCIVLKGKRGEDKTKAMMNVMLDALNKAVEKKSDNFYISQN